MSEKEKNMAVGFHERWNELTPKQQSYLTGLAEGMVIAKELTGVEKSEQPPHGSEIHTEY